MPHIIVKLWPGRTEEMKQTLADKLAADTAEILAVDMDDISISMEEVAQTDWTETVYQKEILEKKENLYKKPGY